MEEPGFGVIICCREDVLGYLMQNIPRETSNHCKEGQLFDMKESRSWERTRKKINHWIRCFIIKFLQKLNFVFVMSI